ncbi:Digalactosyldiacylglycerol synthase 1, chloroplastic [Seminavis robusta]|uniref:Digalactosyldiacylglycerol synthase 1, chloroplastic n=1 Tax=Seminavis robusta TaxID=568900 RepID=A0A9N8HEZ8_9STRA|nr:Digalactosyldiacylglycerol synthase 1, chloroplastic [Seminavis robusta]|eukprot:Sro408_g137030.1 Digalactosyldiacylglycerol synthase 1, chloroplastic (1015) ;mRNA; f:50113-53450
MSEPETAIANETAVVGEMAKKQGNPPANPPLSNAHIEKRKKKNAKKRAKQKAKKAAASASVVKSDDIIEKSNGKGEKNSNDGGTDAVAKSEKVLAEESEKTMATPSAEKKAIERELEEKKIEEEPSSMPQSNNDTRILPEISIPTAAKKDTSDDDDDDQDIKDRTFDTADESDSDPDLIPISNEMEEESSREDSAIIDSTLDPAINNETDDHDLVPISNNMEEEDSEDSSDDNKAVNNDGADIPENEPIAACDHQETSEETADNDNTDQVEVDAGTESAGNTKSGALDTESNGKTHSDAPKQPRTSLVGPVKTVNDDGESIEDENSESNDDSSIIPDSNLRDPKRRICVVTTAALPWRTGTAVNPLLRALYLTRGRPKHHVSLVIPWCDDEKDRKKTLGKEHSFANQEEQEEWIRDFCRARAGCPEEENNLKILFYPAKYNAGFGSIFPSVDICELIPDQEADIAILEEPEHLNWLRVPKPYKETEEEKKQNKMKARDNEDSAATKKHVAAAKEKAELGWRFKFRHVVGIIHTNYKAYAEQYGMGAKFIQAPALCAINALVIRAYCHRVILLSGTLPSLTPYKEVTCNVHGVRGEFLDLPKENEGKQPADNDEQHAPVYFIGKLIWAKGFDKILDLENLYREKNNDYFPIDVYGAGGDEKAIQRAFFGRIPQIQRSESPKPEPSSPDTAEVFTWESSLRSHLVEAVPFKETEKHESVDEFEGNVARRRISVDKSEVNVFEGKALNPKRPSSTKRGSLLENITDKVVPISVVGHTVLKALDTTKATTGAAVAVAKNVVNAGLNVAFANDGGTPRGSKTNSESSNEENGKSGKQKLIFDPPQSVFEFRRNPIQARFLGTKDHVLLRDIREHKIFLNMSITEVLCTTSAEAMAMGKFVILPKHPSNMFFLQFPNCLAYTSLEDCLVKLEYALAHEPVPLTEEVAKKLSWEGANERLFESSSVTKDEWAEWEKDGKIKSDDDAARFHVETGMRGQLIGKFFAREKPSEEEDTSNEDEK